MTKYPFQLGIGSAYPFGATLSGKTANFAVMSSQAQAIDICLYSSDDPLAEPSFIIPLDPKRNRTGNVWHIQLDPLPQPCFYLFQIDHQQRLLDPYSFNAANGKKWGDSNLHPYSPKGVLAQSTPFDWEDDTSPSIPLQKLIIYEMHVRGFTRDDSSHTKYPGTYLGVIEKIPHLVELGINAVELMPIHEFNECEYPRKNPVTQGQLYNYWGYSTVNFFSPMQRYSTGKKPDSAIVEFKTMVKELHRHGIEVLLDVVFNHTAEGVHGNTPISFRGLDENIYYMHDVNGKFLDFTGCGNTFNVNHPVVRQLILESLRYWVCEMHVDGFRFDLASIFCRNSQGLPIPHSPLIDAISKDPILANTKLISEPWDAGGLYQVGSFFKQGSGRWSEWNGRFRDSVRRFIKGAGRKEDFITNLCGSHDLYYTQSPLCSLNFITAHDGFTLADLVSFNHKHNEENGENNNDGSNFNDSWNCGAEGETEDPNILALRARQMRNFHLALMVSRGIPMVLMGDECGHSRRGNNNPWCQDNDFNWYLWDLQKKNQDFYRFYCKLVHFRKEHSLLHRGTFLTDHQVSWHGRVPFQPDWGSDEQFIGFTLISDDQKNDLYIAFNASGGQVEVEFPPANPEHPWIWVVNTANPSPHDFFDPEERFPVEGSMCQMPPHSSLMLMKA